MNERVCVCVCDACGVCRNGSTDVPEEKSRRGETSGRSQSDGLHAHYCTDSSQFNTHAHGRTDGQTGRQRELLSASPAGVNRDLVRVGSSVSLGGLQHLLHSERRGRRSG